MAERSSERPEFKARILYWGPRGSGTSTNLIHVSRKLRADHRGELRRVPTALDPTVAYEVLPISLGEIAGSRVQLQVVAVPGGPEHVATRKQLLDRADGVVLVVDASTDRIDDNLEAFDELRRSLSAYGRSLDELPLVVQYNKRDRADELTLEELHRKLDLRGVPVFEAVASQGKGVLQTLTTISKRVIRQRRDRAGGPEAPVPAEPAPEPAPALVPSPSASREPEPPPVEAEPPLEVEPELAPGAAHPMEAALLEEQRDPRAAAEAEALADRARVQLSEAWGEVTAPVPGREPGSGALRIARVGRASLAGGRGLVVPLELQDAEGRTFAVRLALTLDLLGGADEG